MKNRILVALSSALLLTSCSSDIDLKIFENKEADFIYKTACQYAEKNEFDDAIKILDELEALHPYSKHVADAQITKGECYAKMKKYEEAVTEFEIFVKTHPTHEKVPYALYMLGKLYFEQMPIIERDQEATAKSVEYLSVLNERFPDNKFAKDAERMIKAARQQLAGREVYISKYYQKKNNFAAAICRLNTIIDNYGDTDHMPEALLRLVECYTAMGLFDEAVNVNAVLQSKFNQSTWAKHAQNLVRQKRK